jgi:hypothetical protein
MRHRWTNLKLLPTATAVLAPLLTLAGYPALADAQTRTTAYHGAVLIDGMGGPPLRDAVIVVRDSTLVCVGPSADCGSYLQERGVQVVDLSGSWIIPGLIDLHFHLPPGEDLDFVPLLAAGVTTVREVGPPATGDTIRYPVGHGQVERMARLVERIEAGELPGPRIQYCGPPMHSSEAQYGANPRFFLLRSNTDVEEVVGYLVDRGASCIKLISGTQPDHMREVLIAAAAAGVPGIGHSNHQVPLREQIAWPWSEIHHALWFPPEDLLPPESRKDLPQGEWLRLFVGWSRFDPDAPEAYALAREVERRGIAWVPTLGAQPFPWGMEPAMVNHLIAMGAGPEDKAMLGAALFDSSHRPHSAADSIVAMRDVIDRFQKAWIGVLHRAGVRVLAGSDWTLLEPTRLHDELEHLADAGLSPMDALLAATRHAAAALGLEDRIGTIAAGRIADFVVLEADPLKDIRNTRRIRKVIQGGRAVEGEGLRK